MTISLWSLSDCGQPTGVDSHAEIDCWPAKAGFAANSGAIEGVRHLCGTSAVSLRHLTMRHHLSPTESGALPRCRTPLASGGFGTEAARPLAKRDGRMSYSGSFRGRWGAGDAEPQSVALWKKSGTENPFPYCDPRFARIACEKSRN